jgi:hypothetical protein
MSYGTLSNQTEVAEKNTSMQAIDGLCQRLAEIRARITKISTTLHGPSLKPLEGGKGNAPEPVPTLRRYLDRCHTLALEIEGELGSLEHDLGTP